jgi:hypothetical protein
MTIATIQRIVKVEPIESILASIVTLGNGSQAIDFGSKLAAAELCIHIDFKQIINGRGEDLDFPDFVLPISVLEGPDEMKVGISKQPWGDQLQLGPYDDALVIEEGVDVTIQLGLK